MAVLKNAENTQRRDDDSLAILQAQSALRNGKPDEAARILGRPWTVRAPVEHGGGIS
jgi:FAD synthase